MSTEIEPDVPAPLLHERALGKGADLLHGAALAAVYVVLARMGLGFHAVSAFASLVWPPSAIALVALLVMGKRFWPGIALGAFVANLWNGAPLAVAAAIAAGNTGEALFAAWALRRIPGFRRTLDRLEDVLGLVVLGGVLAPTISATVGVASLVRGGIVAEGALWTTWRAWWLGDSIAILVLAPLLLTWRPSSPSAKDRLPVAESALLAILVVIASYFLFDLTTGGMASLLAPLLIWASLRFHVRGAARATFLATTVAVWATARGHGPFASASIEEGLVRLQVFMALTAATFLVLGAMTLERGKAEDAKRLAEEGIRERELRYRTLAEAVEQLMWISDDTGRVVFVNHQWETTIGPAESAHGTGWVELIHPEDRPELLAARQEGLAKGRPYRLECRIRTRDGQYRWILARVVPVKDARGEPTSWFGAAADVHDLKTAQEELRVAKEAAERANRAKDRFLATLSHELRTPLTPVLAYSSMLEQDTGLAPETRRRIEVVRRNAELEARLIDDLLDLTRVATGKLEIHGGNIQLFEALDHAVEICRQEAAAKGITLVRESSDGEVFIRADPARMQQVVWNLLNNAIKFTPSGGRIVLRRAPAPDGRVAVEISDTGSGIEPSEIPRIFQPFEQSAHGKGGLGLGLAISRALVVAQGGTLTATSDGADRGATFRIELPAGEAEDCPLPSPASVRLVGTEDRRVERRVLLVEDHLDSANAARELLAEISCRVVVANSVEEALRAAQSQPFDLVLSDLGLPDGSGLELMRTLKDRFGLSGIAITGYGMRDDLRRAREAGFVDHLVKPITFQRLSESVERFFAEGQSARVPT